MKNNVERVVREFVRPYLQSHQGDVEIIDVKDGVVKIKLRGACSGCPSSDQTVSDFIETILAEHVPGFEKVEVSKSVSPELLEMARSILSGKGL